MLMTLYDYVTHECDVEELPVHDEIYIKDIQALERALAALELLGC